MIKNNINNNKLKKNKKTKIDKRLNNSKKLIGDRIGKFLAKCGICSRRKAEKLVLEGKIKINGLIVKDLSKKVFLDDIVEYEGKILKPQEKVVIAVNKPIGYLSTVYDKFGGKLITDLIGEYKKYKVYPAGRLDKNSRGLVILTNDGEIAYKLTHPKFNIPKTYEVLLNKNLEEKDLITLTKGICIDNKILSFINIEFINLDEIINKNGKKFFLHYSHLLKTCNKIKNYQLLKVTINEGRKRIIRIAFKKLNYEVIDLKRVQIGSFNVYNYFNQLKEGNFKILDKKEISELLKT